MYVCVTMLYACVYVRVVCVCVTKVCVCDNDVRVCVCVFFFHAPFSGVRIGARPSDGIHLVLTFEKLSLWPQLPVAPMGEKCNS